MNTIIHNKKGRKQGITFGFTKKFVKTWALFNGEWIYQGMCGQHVVTNSDGEYSYITEYDGIQIKQELA